MYLPVPTKPQRSRARQNHKSADAHPPPSPESPTFSAFYPYHTHEHNSQPAHSQPSGEISSNHQTSRCSPFRGPVSISVQSPSIPPSGPYPASPVQGQNLGLSIASSSSPICAPRPQQIICIPEGPSNVELYWTAPPQPRHPQYVNYCNEVSYFAQ